MRGTVAVVVLVWVAAASRASAQGGAFLGEPARTAALAGSVTGRPGEVDAVAANPGALADLDRSELSLTVHGGRASLWMAREGEGGREVGRSLAGLGGGVVARLPGPPALRRVRLGLGAHLPTSYLLRLSAPPRPDQPTAVAYGQRAGRTAVAAALGLQLPAGLGLGASLSITPALRTTTIVGYDASRGDSPDDNVVVNVDNELVMAGALGAGLRWAPIERLAFGVAWREGQAVEAEGPNDVRAGGLVVDAEVDFYEVFAPQEVSIGVAGAPVEALSLSADLLWSDWSAFRTIHDRAAEPSFVDTWSLRLGAEWTPRPWYAVRAGWAFEPSPVPSQTGLSNFVDADRYVIAMGLGVDLERLGLARLRVDLYARWHLLGEQRATKDVASLPDAEPRVDGVQIDNLGYPGFRAGGTFLQGGITLSVPLSAATEAP